MSTLRQLLRCWLIVKPTNGQIHLIPPPPPSPLPGKLQKNTDHKVVSLHAPFHVRIVAESSQDKYSGVERGQLL